MDQKKLFLLDAYALIFRSYYAFISRPIRNSKGQNTSAIFGFVNTLDEILRKEKPTHIAVAFDPPTPTFRNELYAEYKAHRLATPEEIKFSVPYIKEILNAFNIPVLEINGYEADDVIGTVAKMAEKEGFEVYMMTPDKDYMQLISDRVYVYKPRRSGGEADIIKQDNLKESFGVENPCQVIDVLALWGDSSDNVPGAPGIGEKTAKSLIAEYGSLEGLYEHIDDLKGKQKENLLGFRQQIEMARKLVTIHLEVPVEIDYEKLKVTETDKVKLRSIFDELEFRTLTTRLIGDTAAKKMPAQGTLFGDDSQPEAVHTSLNYKTIKDVPHTYHLVSTPQQRKELVEKLLSLEEICFDTETTGIDAKTAGLVGISFSFASHEGYYINIPPQKDEAKKIVREFSFVFQNENIAKTGQNIKYDIQVLSNYDIKVKGEIFDTMIAHYLLQPELQHNMDYLSKIYLKYLPVSIESLIGPKGKNQLNMRMVNVEEVKEYAAEDADVTWQLTSILKNELKKNKLTSLANEVEMPLITVLADMENAGFKLNTNELNEYAEVLNKEIDQIEKEIYHLANEQFNISSPKQLGEILFEKLKIADNAKKTKTKQYSTSEEVLLQIKDKHEIVGKVLDYRTLKKLLNTYVETLPKLINPVTGKIHTSFDQAWVATGRLSSKNPNLQNIPIRDEKGREIRKSFVASNDDYILLSADYSQIELRLMAHMSGDEHMIEAFLQGEDIHAATAAKIYNVLLSEVTGSMRRAAKTANFGIIYGISAFGLSQRLGISRTEAKTLIDGYFSSYKKVKDYMDKSIRNAKEKGYVETIMGRRRYLKDIHSANAIVRGNAERNAINAPLQGSAADIIKKAMVNIHRILSDSMKTKMILQVHDELIFDVFKPELDKVKEIVKNEMEHAVKLSVPLIAEIGTGKNWLEAH